MNSNETIGSSEKELIRVSPHPMAFFGQMVLWIYVIAVVAIAWLYMDKLVALVSSIPLIGNYIGSYTIYFIVAIAVLIPTLIYSILKISWRYFIIGFLLTVVIPIVYPIIGIPQWLALPTIIGASILALAIVEIHRRAHKYIITNRRIIFEYNGLFKKNRRDVVYSRLSDVILEKSFLGKIFNYGNIIPISQSSMGMGEDLAAASAGIGVSKGVVAGAAVTGGRTVNVPRSRSQYMLYAVPNPEKIYEVITQSLKESEEAPYLKRIVEKLDKE